MSADMALVQAYLTNMQMALQNLDVPHAEALLESVQHLISPPSSPSLVCSPMHIDVGVGLDAGIQRIGKPNEDFAWAFTGLNIQTQERYGLFIVADGMGGHANGRMASRLAVETIVAHLLPYLQYEHVQTTLLGDLLSEVVVSANTEIFARNQGASHPQSQMGTTVVAAVTFGLQAFIANVGDSRTYLYRPSDGLRQVTRDHSHVADLVKSGDILPERLYTHPQRNLIYRCLGSDSVEVDLFTEQIQDGDMLLLCSDGMWEMTRNNEIENVLSTQSSPDEISKDLVQLAITGGGHDNIGLVIAQFQTDIAQMQTVRLSQVQESLPEKEITL